MAEPSQETVFTREANRLLEMLADVDKEIEALHLEHRKAVDAVNEQYTARLDPLVEDREALVDKIKGFFVTHRKELTGNTKHIELRAGTLSARETSSIEVDDEDSAIDYLRRHHWLRRFATRGKWKLNKAALRKDPWQRATRIPGIRLVVRERLTITLNKPLKEHVRDLNPLRRSL